MPIRPDLRKFYRGPVWRAIRARILVRAGARFADGKHLGGAHCEQCHVPDRSFVARGPFGTWSMGDGWHNNQGQLMRWTDPFRLSHTSARSKSWSPRHTSTTIRKTTAMRT